MAYFITCLKPALVGKLTDRNGHEMEMLAEALDHLLRGDLATGLTVLMQRFKSLETYSHEGNWDKAKHLEMVKHQKVTCVSQREAELARGNAILERKLENRGAAR
jgi:hypothetical protein